MSERPAPTSSSAAAVNKPSWRERARAMGRSLVG